MEFHLLNSYIKLTKENHIPFIVKVRQLPINVIIFLILSIICFIASIVAWFIGRSIIWFYILTIIEFVFAFLLSLAQERWEIKDSSKRYADFRDSANEIYTWLSCYNIRTKEEVEMIQVRLYNHLKQQEEVRKQKKDKMDKWMQTLIIPLILAIVTSLISNQVEISIVISYAVSFLAIVAMIYGIVGIFNGISNLLDDRKNINIKLFTKALQNVIDVKFIFMDKN